MPHRQTSEIKNMMFTQGVLATAKLAHRTRYDGDIKDGSSKCTDDVYADAARMFNALSKPAIYVPGDNEWTDCHQSSLSLHNEMSFPCP
jgi:hypothetical protein